MFPEILPVALLHTLVEPPVIPVGLDAYRMWDRWPYVRIGARAYMRSTYDRTGGNESADAGHFLYQEADDFNVTLDVEGPGILYFARYNHWHGSPWHYEIDGTDHIIEESSSADPEHPVEGAVFMPEHLLPAPLTWTWSTTKGADLMWVPMKFEKSFRMAYSRTHYGTGYFIYHQYLPGARLSQPIKPWDGKTPPDKDVLDLIARAGADIAPKIGTPEGERVGVRAMTGEVSLRASEPVAVAHIEPGPAMLRAIEFSAPRDRAVEFGRARLRATWDQRDHASVDAPVALFFGAGTLYNRDDAEYLVKGFPMHVRFDDERVYVACYFPMPFFRSAKFELIAAPGAEPIKVRWTLRYATYTGPANHVAYFHATYVDHPEPELGKDLVLLDTREIEGGGHWCGHFVGTAFIFSHDAFLGTLEGDPRFYFDDSRTPQAHGTGTEEWGGGGDYWGGRNMTLPFAGHPTGAKNADVAKCNEDKIESAYRFLLADLMPFGKNAVITLEHGPLNDSQEHYETVTYWYGLNSPGLVLTDTLDVGDPESEQAHNYHSPHASAPATIESRYEWGPDTLLATGGRPLKKPRDFAEIEFQAEADKTYTIWVRGHACEDILYSDDLWIQFDELIGTNQRGFVRAGHDRGYGNWRDWSDEPGYGWGSARPKDPLFTVRFAKAGKHRLRIQPRMHDVALDQIWLSATQTTPPIDPGPRPKIPGNKEEIVLDASDVTTVSGAVTAIDDPDTSCGKALHLPGVVIHVFPPHTETERHTAGTSEFTLALSPDNLGVLLRRTLDYAFPNQRAEVYVADVSNGDVAAFQKAGVWYLAGSNTCVYSCPREELGATQHIVQTSNRRFRDDEFLIGPRLTQGRPAIRVRVTFTPVQRPLFPGHPIPQLAWSEIRYAAYCFVMPKPPTDQECMEHQK